MISSRSVQSVRLRPHGNHVDRQQIVGVLCIVVAGVQLWTRVIMRRCSPNRARVVRKRAA